MRLKGLVERLIQKPPDRLAEGEERQHDDVQHKEDRGPGALA